MTIATNTTPARKKRIRNPAQATATQESTRPMVVDSSASASAENPMVEVEAPVHTTSASRASHAHLLKLALRVTTLYKSMAGARRQPVCSTRRQGIANGSLTGHQWASPNPTTGIALGDAPDTFTARKGMSGNRKNGAQDAVVGAEGTPRVSRLQWMSIPELLTEDVWERHGYSLSDIRRTLDVFPARVIWQLVLGYNRAATNASSRVCSDAEPKLTCGGRSTAVQKLLGALKETHTGLESRSSVTWNPAKATSGIPTIDDRHSPGLPVHRLEQGIFNEMARHVSSVKEGGGSAEEGPRLAKGIFSWRGILVAPLELSKAGDLLLMSRVIPWDAYIEAHGTPSTLRACPNSVLAPEGFYALLDECFFFFAGRRDDCILEAQRLPSLEDADMSLPQAPNAVVAPPAALAIETSSSVDARLWSSSSNDTAARAVKRVRV